MHVHVNAWLASLTLLHHKTYASMHGHMNACSWYQERNRKETLIYHVKEKKKKKRRLKIIKRVKIEACYVKGKKKQKQKTQISVFGHKYACAYIGLRVCVHILRACVCMQKACIGKHVLNPNPEMHKHSK